MIELEELIPGARNPLKIVATESVSDALISDRPKGSRSRTLFDVPSFRLGVSQEEKEVLPKGVVVVNSQPDSLAIVVQEINCDVEDIVMKCMTTSAQCISTSSLPGPILLCSQEDNDAFVDRSLHNAMMSRIISYELKLYVDFVFNSEEEQRSE
ncbi:hypothetical protein Cgig2_023942 [Carnegiea gigantea]|uniref:Uncharacterized protein n=1 Tax=Carnegiea gigantea TaxID=171969 RepID=A0A9Q1GL54_9CARY|nr:hypothetical protein Cgig2_023942 [Carnegiea gigantea]